MRVGQSERAQQGEEQRTCLRESSAWRRASVLWSKLATSRPLTAAESMTKAQKGVSGAVGRRDGAAATSWEGSRWSSAITRKQWWEKVCQWEWDGIQLGSGCGGAAVVGWRGNWLQLPVPVAVAVAAGNSRDCDWDWD